MVLCRVMFLLRWENLTSTSFLGFRERCQYLSKDQWKRKVRDYLSDTGSCVEQECFVVYLHVDTGLGSTTPAVYTA